MGRKGKPVPLLLDLGLLYNFCGSAFGVLEEFCFLRGVASSRLAVLKSVRRDWDRVALKLNVFNRLLHQRFQSSLVHVDQDVPIQQLLDLVDVLLEVFRFQFDQVNSQRTLILVLAIFDHVHEQALHLGQVMRRPLMLEPPHF